MGIFDLYSKRQKRKRGEFPDVFVYDDIPNKLRVQIVHIIQDGIGTARYYKDDLPAKAYKEIHAALCREYGIFSLDMNSREKDEAQVLNFLLRTIEYEKVLDVVELCIKYIDIIIRGNWQNYIYNTEVKAEPDKAVNELNERFKENGVGYSYESGELIRIDSTYLHAEVVKPTLTLLSNKKFSGANEEYLNAHEHYRHGRNKECLTECLKAFESTLKTICKEKTWTHAPTDTAKKLIQVCFQNNLVPSFTQNQFTSLQNLLESGIPTIRNKLGGHGQGAVPQKVDDEMVRYALNLTGSNIVFLIELSGLT